MKIRLNQASALLICAALVVLICAGPAGAQRKYAHYSKKQVAEIIKLIEDNTDVFRKEVDRYLDRSRLDGTRAEDRINDRVKEFEHATDDLRKDFDRRDSWWESRDHVRRMLDKARPVADIFRRGRFGPALEVEWKRLRRNINRLATTYELPLVG